ncbi:Protein turtle A [Merluccius polli]|uniref:Protein turtle A n=1 Tax=Merluccius polli TaxID=89951 RepID=A0AA47PBK1_MERPO|nr:Protein turtle A [Merluccius polli]
MCHKPSFCPFFFPPSELAVVFSATRFIFQVSDGPNKPSRVCGRVSLTRGASLRVERLSLEDEGWFECRILLLDSKTDEFRNGTWTFLSITAPPVFIKTPPSYVEVLLGDSLTLSCGAHGNPRPTVVWHKDETPIEKHEKIKVLNGSLSLTTATRDTAGVYKCHVSNSEGNLTHSTQLQVKGPPIIIISPGDTTLNMSQDAVLQCQADAYPSNLTYEWLKQGQNVYHIESLKSRVKILVDGTLLIPNLMPEDAGNYTCIPTNGILTPPSASAHLKVKHPARVGRMSRETLLPAGMEGVIVCPVQADPPVLYVNWTKDGNNINVDNFPGWMVNSEGSVFITTANDNAVGMYTCTAYNSYGTMGQSEPTQVILKDPPAFQVAPRPEYLQEVGRELLIPCEAKGDPLPNITWSKIGPTPRSPYVVLANGSLLLQPLSKDHHGGWECLATNHVATVSAGTVVLALGTSPHAVTSVSVTTEMNQANVSWVPGFDGGFSQKFTVWVKQASRGKHEWASLPVPTSKDNLLVTSLLAATNYQFSVLPQNKLGSGPFSGIVSVRTQVLPTEAPLVVLTLPTLDPPTCLSANRTDQGVLLQWSPPEFPSSPLTGYVLQARRDQGQWVILSSDVGANQRDMLVQGLLRDSSYDLRLMSCSNKILSVPSESINMSTAGMEMYPIRASFLEFIPQPLLAGVIGGVCFLFMAIVLALVTACFMSHRRQKRRIKRRHDLHSAFQKSSSPEARRPPRSPDSILKLKLCPGLPFFPSSSASQSDRSTFDKGSRGEYQDQRKQLLSNSSPPPHYTLFESHLGCQAPSSSALESICRGPDGRFLIQPLPEGSSPPSNENLKNVVIQSNGGASGAGSNRTSFRDSPKSSILSSEKEERKDSPLTVDVPELSRPPSSPGRVKAMARNFSRHGCFYSDDEQGSEALLERASFYSDNSEKRTSGSMRRHCPPANTDPLSLGRRALGLDGNSDKPSHSSYQPMEEESQLTNASTLVSRLDSEQEEDSMAKCLKLAKERQEMEEQLKAYTTNQRTKGWAGGEHQSSKANSPHRDVPVSEEDPVWKLQDVTLRQKHRPTGQTSRVSDFRKACYFGSTSSPMDRIPSSKIQWDISPVTSVTSIVPVRGRRDSPTRRPYPYTHNIHETTEDSLAVESSHSPVMQNTSLPMLSPSIASESSPILCLETPKRGRSRSPDREADFCYRRSIADEGWENQRQGAVRSKTPQAYGTEHWDATHRASPADRESPTGPVLPYTTAALYSRSDAIEGTDRRDPSPSQYSTLPYKHSEGGAKANLREDHGKRLHISSGFNTELEREGVRARSRRSDKCLFSESPSVISPLTIVEECESDQSHFSVPRMSDCFNVKRSASPRQMSPVQTSAILEYLSLPGFIEMSVDEPAEETELADTSGQSLELKSVVVKPDVVPRNWEVHCQENLETKSSHKAVSFEDDTRSVNTAETRLGAYEKPDCRYSRHLEARDSTIKGQTLGRPKSQSPGPEKTSKQLYYEKSQLILGKRTKSPERPQSRLASSSAHTLLNAAKGVVDIVSRRSQSFVEGYHHVPEPPKRHAVPEPPERHSVPEPPERHSVPQPHERHSAPEPPERHSVPQPHERHSAPEPPERHATQRNNRNNITSRICQAPVPFLKKSLSIGPCRTLSGMGHPRAFLKKSISLQRWEHFESPRAYISERCYWDEFPNPDVRLKSYSLGRGPSYLPRPGPTWTEYVPSRRLSFESVERPHHSQRPLANSPYLNYSMYPPRSTVHTRMEPSDPRRQTTVFPEVSRWPVSYQESLRSAQHKYVPMSSSIPVPEHPYRHFSRGEPVRAIDPRRGPPRSYLPRGNSWPSPHLAPLPPGEADSSREMVERPLVRGGEPEYREAREGGRTSYASQSSGRGSAGFLRQSLSITPTLLSSPETTEESERHRAQIDRRERRAKRRNTSVDESYEWDSADPGMDAEVLEAMKFDQSQMGASKERGVFRYDQTHGPQDQKRRGPSPSVSPPASNPSARGVYSRSLSEARFNALRLEYQEYMQALESNVSTREACLTPDPESDSDSGSALL